MRNSKFAMALIMSLSMPMVSYGESANECFPWETEVNQGETASLGLSAELCYELAEQSNGKKKLWGSNITTDADAVADVFDTELEVATWTGGVRLEETGEAIAYAELIVAGQEVIKSSFEFKELALEEQIEILGFEQSISQELMIGAIPAVISFGVMTDGVIDLKAYLKKNQVGLTAVPQINAFASANAGFGNDLVFVGFSGALDILEDVLDFDAKIVVPNKDEMVVQLAGSNKLSALSGKIDTLVKVVGIEKRQILAEMEGIEREDIFLEETIQVQ